MWFGTHGGGLYRLASNRWTTFDAASSALPDDIVISLLEAASASGGTALWVGTRRGLAILERDGADVLVESESDAEYLLLAGEPLGEPVFAYGPFVMNTSDEVREAIRDFQSGKFGSL